MMDLEKAQADLLRSKLKAAKGDRTRDMESAQLMKAVWDAAAACRAAGVDISDLVGPLVGVDEFQAPKGSHWAPRRSRRRLWGA